MLIFVSIVSVYLGEIVYNLEFQLLGSVENNNWFCFSSCGFSPLNALVIVYIFQGQDEFMGRCVVTPLVKFDGQGPPAPRLLWYGVTRAGEEAGEILAAFELFLVRFKYMDKS